MKRNDPCDCGSGLKYKKCCGNEAVKAKERNDQIAADHEAMLKRIEENNAAHINDSNQPINNFSGQRGMKSLLAVSMAIAPLMIDCMNPNIKPRRKK